MRTPLKRRNLLRVLAMATAMMVGLCPGVLRAASVHVDSQELDYQKRLEQLRQDLDGAQGIWEESIDDSVSDQELKRRYQGLQEVCRQLYKRKGGFGTARQKQLCEIAQYLTRCTTTNWSSK